MENKISIRSCGKKKKSITYFNNHEKKREIQMPNMMIKIINNPCKPFFLLLLNSEFASQEKIEFFFQEKNS